MRKEGWITAEPGKAPWTTAAAVRPGPAGRGRLRLGAGLHTAEAVKVAGQNAPDLVVRLTVDPLLQREGAEAVRQTMATEAARSGASQSGLAVAVGRRGDRAMVGGTSYAESPFNRAVQARRQPGSSFKPFIYAAAVERGVLPTDIRVDEPIKIGDWKRPRTTAAATAAR
ncbi:penicillin-binding transpeptidase domain-containing protein [Caulobacter segnis]